MVLSKPKLHRWDLDIVHDVYKCVNPDLGAVDSGQRCWRGCDVEVTHKELFESGLMPNEKELGLGATLSMIVNQRNG